MRKTRAFVPGVDSVDAATPVVAMGASAGGLDPLMQIFSAVPPDTGAAFLVVQHMDPVHKPMLCSLLQKATQMRVCQATEGSRIAPNTVYVIPPGAELSVDGDQLRVAHAVRARGAQYPINALFMSLASERGERAVAVVLSGMGSDGALGLQAIKAQGGLALVQEPGSAQYDSMPRSALRAVEADHVAPPGQLPSLLTQAIARACNAPASDRAETSQRLAMEAVLAHVRARTRHDFSLYKPSTLTRRIERRMAVHGVADMAAYAALLSQSTSEVELLFQEMLIGVTCFFRDPSAWRELQDEALPELLARRASDAGPVRAWVAGCSTGEEAYSLAIALREAAEAQQRPELRRVQIFATDLNAEAIALARKGQYSHEIAAHVGPERLSRYFVPQANGYAVEKSIREMVLFAQHDVSQDPPFTRLDVLCCRNVLIYFSAALQQRLMPLFHYCLRPGGLLLLGGSETVGRAQGLFAATHPKSRLYRRLDHPAGAAFVHFPSPPPLPAPAAQMPDVSKLLPSAANLQTLAEQVLLQEFTPAAVLVTAAGDIVYIHGRTGKYLEPAAGKANWNLHVMARPNVRAQLSVALRTALQSQAPVELRGLRLEEDAAPSFVDITVHPILQAGPPEALAMVLFRDVAPPSAPALSCPSGANGTDAALVHELARAHEEIRALRQEMLASREELQASNEELQSTNEELQSANEELTTSKEEAQSMNEELQTINSELQSKLDDLALAQSDMQNLLNSTNIATLFLDGDLNVRRFTTEVTRIIHLRETDVGRPLSDLATELVYPALTADARETLRTLAFSEKEVTTTDGRWYSVRIMPYRAQNDVIQGTVITFVDITAAKELEARLRKE